MRWFVGWSVGIAASVSLLPDASSQEIAPWVEESFADFVDGRFEASGANLYVSAAGTLQLVNRWDVNHDGYIDFFFGNTHDLQHTQPVWLYYQQRSEPVSLRSSGAYRVAAADLNGDGWADLVIGNRDNNVTDDLPAYVYYGGASGFPDSASVELPARAIGGIAIADLDGDARADLVFANEAGDVSYIYWNGPNGLSWRDRTDLATESARAVATADLDADGRIDLIVANGSNTGGGSFIYWGDGKNFTSSHRSVLETRDPVAVVTGDLDADGNIDLVFANARASDMAEGSDITTSIYWGEAGRYSSANRTELQSGPSADVTVADLDANGFPDLIFAATPASSIFWGSREGYAPDRATRVPTYAAVSVTVGDYDANGRTDLVFSEFRNEDSFETDSVVFLNRDSGFDFEHPLRFATRGANDAVMADIDGDGHSDVVFANRRRGNAKGTVPSFVYLGGADGYHATHRLELPSSGANEASFADFNDDGWTDVLVDNSDHDDATLQFGGRIFWGGADGIAPDRYSRVDVDYPWASSAADFDRDGHLDILFSAVTPGRDALFVYWGGETHYSRERRTVLSLTDGRATAVADLNGDGFLDVVGTSVEQSVAKIFWGGSDGFSRERFQVLPGFAPVSAEVADLDDDGYADLILCNFWDPTDHHFGMPSYIYWGGPSGLSVSHRSELLTYGAHDAAVADFNDDGHLDIVFSNYRTDDSRDPPAYVYWGGDDGFDSRRRSLLPAHGGAGMLAADLNRDGSLDLVFANHTTNEGNHELDSQILWGSERGFHGAETTWLPGLGPHNMLTVDVGNRLTRKLEEEYVSSIHRADGTFSEIQLLWDGETPHGTGLSFQVRTASSREGIAGATWLGPDGPESYAGSPGERVRAGGEAQQWVQYRVVLRTPDGGSSPLLRRVEVRLR